MNVGVLGGGQLGLMVAEAIAPLGHGVRVLEPDPEAPCSQRLAEVQRGALTDAAALERFFAAVDVATYDSENIDAGPLRAFSQKLAPSLHVLEVSQDRRREKTFLAEHGFGPVSFVAVAPGEDVRAAALKFGLPCIVKSARLGYDGKGQQRVVTEADLAQLPASDHGYVIEEVLTLSAEVSCLVARSQSAHAFPVFENEHVHHVLDVTVLPARVSAALQLEARTRALAISEALNVRGLLTVEFFIGRGRDGVERLFVNELAPRVHNSGHVTRKACSASQFDVLARILTGAPLTTPTLLPGGWCMGQLLGDVWLAQGRSGGALDLRALCDFPDVVEVYLYGKREARKGRKMGHFIVHAADASQAVARARAFRARLLKP